MRQVVNTALPQGGAVNLVPAADYRPAVLSGQPLVTPLVRGTVSGHLVIGVAVPVVRGGRVPYVLAVRLTPGRLRELLATQVLPPGSFASITDAREVVVARSDALHEQLAGRQALAGVRAQYEGRDAGLFHARTLDGLERVLAFQSVPAAQGWRVFVAEPASIHASAWRAPLLALAAGGVALVVAASLLSVLAARKLLRPVRELSRHAHALADGSTGVSVATLAPAPIWELEQLRRGLAQAEAAIEARSRSLAELTATLDLAAAFVRDPHGTIRYWSRGCEELYGWTAQEAVGCSAHGLLRTVFPQSLQEVESALAREGRWTGDLRHTTRDGRELVVAVRKALRRDAQGRPLSVVESVTDVTAARQAEAALAELNATLEQQVRQRTAELESMLDERKALEAVLRRRTSQAEAASHAKSAFLAHMSHEFRTPLNAVIGLSQLLQRRELPQDVGRFVGHIHDAGEQLLALVSDVLDLSRIESGEMVLEAVDFAPQALLDTVLALVRPQADAKALTLASEVEAELPERLVGDPMRLRQVLLNLLSNALKFTAQGSVTLRVRSVPIDEQHLLLRVEVADSGIGIDPAHHQRIFEPFTQADGSITRRFGGTGLGLSIVRRLVDMMGGTLALHSEPGKGSVFSVALPLRRG